MARGTFLEKRLNVFVLLFVGTVDLIRDYFRHDTGDAIVVILIFFMGGPLLIYLLSRRSSSEQRRTDSPRSEQEANQGRLKIAPEK